MLLPRSSSSRVLCTSAIARIVHRGNAPELDTLLLLNDVLQFLQACSIALVIRSWLSLHVTTALDLSFLVELAVDLSVLHTDVFLMNVVNENEHYVSRVLLERFKLPGKPLQCFDVKTSTLKPRSVDRSCAARV